MMGNKNMCLAVKILANYHYIKFLYSCMQSIILMLQQFVDRLEELDFLEKSI